MSSNHESYLLSSNEQRDMEEWVREIHRIILGPFGGGKKNKGAPRRELAFLSFSIAIDVCLHLPLSLLSAFDNRPSCLLYRCRS